jgi:hypothetical protein
MVYLKLKINCIIRKNVTVWQVETYLKMGTLQYHLRGASMNL